MKSCTGNSSGDMDMIRGMCRDCTGCLLCQEPVKNDYDEEWERFADEEVEDVKEVSEYERHARR